MNDDDGKRINIEDLPKAEEELTDEDAKHVQGGDARAGVGFLRSSDGGGTWASNTSGGSLGAGSGNTLGGSLAIDPSDPSKH